MVEPIRVRNGVFFDNRLTIAKGTIIPNGSVILCCSKVRGDFSNEGEHLLLMGNPSKVVKKGIRIVIAGLKKMKK